MKPTLSILLTFFLLITLLIVTTAFNNNSESALQREALREQLSRPIFNLPITQATSGVSLAYLDRNQSINDPEVKALSALVWEKTNDVIFFEKSPDVRRPIASITKLMTAAVVLDNASTTENVKISFFAVRTEGSAGELYPNEKLTVSDLLHAMLLESSNDAAIALAEYVGRKYTIGGGGEAATDEFVFLMNKKSAELGLLNTQFADPSGLNDTASFSTAKNVAELVHQLRSNSSYDIIWEILKKDEIVLISQDEGIIHTFTNNNPFVAELKNIIGGKTGYTEKAGESMVLVVESPDGEIEIIYVVLGSTDRIEDMRILINWLSSAYVWQK